MAQRVMLLVGTRKGAFILDGDAGPARLAAARAALRRLADPRRLRRTAETGDPLRRRRQPVVRAGGLAERRPRRDLDPLVARA